MSLPRRSHRFALVATVALFALVCIVVVLWASQWESISGIHSGGSKTGRRVIPAPQRRNSGADVASSPNSPSKRALDMPLCVLHRDCQVNVGSRQQLVVTPRLDARHVRVVPEDAARSMLAARGSWVNRSHRVGFVVEDGCAMGHLTKDVGVVMHAARWLEQELRFAAASAAERVDLSGTRQPPRTTLSVLWANPCVTKQQLTAENVEDDLARGPSPGSAKSLFVRVLRHWWLALQDWASSSLLFVRIEFVSHEDVVHWAGAPHQPNAQNAAFTTVLLRRPLHWRWFRHTDDAQEYRRYMVDSYFNVGDTENTVEVDWELRIVLVERAANRHYQERDAAAMLQSHLSPFAAAARSAAGKNAPHPFSVSVQLVRLEALTFSQQVRLLSRASVMIAAHGAALALIPLLRPDAWVIELFPANFGYWLYEELAVVSGMRYMSIHGKRVSHECRSKRVCRDTAVQFRRAPFNETLRGADPEASSTLLYDELRSWNGFSKCKNCDVMWCSEDRGAEREECMAETLLPAVRSALRNVMRNRIRASGAGPSGLISTSWWLDRRG